MKKIDAKFISLLIGDLNSRTREVLNRRFGLKSGERETLEAVGRDFGITRERIRQIEADGLKKASEAATRGRASLHTKSIYKEWANYLRTHGGLRREETFIQEAGSGNTGRTLFLLAIGDQFTPTKENDLMYAGWTLNAGVADKAERVIALLTQVFKKYNKTVNEKELAALYKNEAPEGESLNRSELLSYIDIAKDIEKGPNGLWGFADWAEINPRGLRDKAYLVYKKERKPLHFTEVAKLISLYGFAGQKKKILHQSVHNDLIRDPRFVLVGRGMYALGEWGYQPGTVKNVITEVMQATGRPMTQKEVLAAVLKQRKIKETTVLINLQNKKYFARMEDGKYVIGSGAETAVA